MMLDTIAIRNAIIGDDLSLGQLVRAIVWLAVPSIFQGVLSNCYAFNDFMFVGHMADKEASAAGTAALSATVGLQVIVYAMHNCIPSGCNAFVAQYKGAKSTKMVASSFRSAFYSCLIISTVVAILGKTHIKSIAAISNSTPEVTAAIEDYLGALLMGSPAFSLLLLIDGFFKACGDTVTPLKFEISSLLLNTLFNYIFVFRFGWGITGAAVGTVVSKLVPSVYGLFLLQKQDNSIGETVNLLDFSFENSLQAGVQSGSNVTAENSAGYSSVPVLDESTHGMVELTGRGESSVTSASTDAEDADEESNKISDSQELASPTDSTPVSTVPTPACLRFMCSTSFEMFKIGCFDSVSSCIYGITFTWMTRLAGFIGSGPQTGLGAAMRGLEWMAYCLSEGFLVSALTCVGQCIGAKKYKRAMDAAWICIVFSSLVVGAAGLPFLLMPHKLATILTRDSVIQHFCAEYVRIVGCSMLAVGFEAASYGTMIGAGKARTLAFVNGLGNLSRVPFALALMKTPANLIPGIFMYIAVGVGNKSALLERSKIWAEDQTAAFGGICWVIAFTAMLKASTYLVMFLYRTFSGLYFSDCSLIDGHH